MRVRKIITIILILFSVYVLIGALTQSLARCDIIPSRYGVNIEGAHMVSEGAYFRFWIYNDNTYSVNVTVNGADSLHIPSRSGADYDVVAPLISVPFEQVTYKFQIISSNSSTTNTDFPVLVLSSALVQIFDLAVPILAIVAAVIIALVAVVLVRRRRTREKA